MYNGPDIIKFDTPEARLADLVLRRYGIVMRDRHTEKVCRALRDRITRRGDLDISTYIDALDHGHSHEDDVHLISQVTTNVTAFYREAHHFENLRRHIGSLPRDRAVRCWSAGCSTGEEPWSLLSTIAPVLDDARRQHLLVLGTDIDAPSLTKARTAIYPRAALDDIPQVYRSQFEVGTETVQPREDLRPLMRIRALNLVNPFPFEARFDVIFCRNTLIYFEPEQREDVVSRLTARMRLGGLLMLGHSETLHNLPMGLEPVGLTTYQRVA